MVCLGYHNCAASWRDSTSVLDASVSMTGLQFHWGKSGTSVADLEQKLESGGQAGNSLAGDVNGPVAPTLQGVGWLSSRTSKRNDRCRYRCTLRSLVVYQTAAGLKAPPIRSLHEGNFARGLIRSSQYSKHSAFINLSA